METKEILYPSQTILAMWEKEEIILLPDIRTKTHITYSRNIVSKYHSKMFDCGLTKLLCFVGSDFNAQILVELLDKLVST